MDNDQADILSGAVGGASVAFVVTDPTIEDNPIVYVNDAFQTITLYSREFALGRNCRFLQGQETEEEALAELRQGLRNGKPFDLMITNHRADGTSFRNHLVITPVADDTGQVSAFLGVQREVEGNGPPQGRDLETLDLLRELQHRVKNHLAMVVSLIRMQAARNVTPESMRAIGRRVEALALLYEEMFDATRGRDPGDVIHTGAYLSRIANVVARIANESAIRVNIDCEEIDLPVDRAARLGLLLSELLTNALEHAFKGRETGRIDVRFQRLGSNAVRLTVEDDGVGLPEGSNWPWEADTVERQTERAESISGDLDTTGHNGHSGVGGTIITSLTQVLEARLNVNRALQGTIVTVEFETGEAEERR